MSGGVDRRAVAWIAIRSPKERRVEGVVSVKAKIELYIIPNRRALLQRDVEVRDGGGPDDGELGWSGLQAPGVSSNVPNSIPAIVDGGLIVLEPFPLGGMGRAHGAQRATVRPAVIESNGLSGLYQRDGTERPVVDEQSHRFWGIREEPRSLADRDVPDRGDGQDLSAIAGRDKMRLVGADAAAYGSRRALEGPTKSVTVLGNGFGPCVSGLKEETALVSVDMAIDLDFEAVIPVLAERRVVFSHESGAPSLAVLAKRRNQIERPDGWRCRASAATLLGCGDVVVGIGDLLGPYVGVCDGRLPVR